MTESKRCSCCRQTKPLSDFYKKRTNSDGHHHHCKECHNRFTNDNYHKNKGYYQKRQREYRRKKNAEFYEFLIPLKSKPCADCGKTYPWYVMDFDHVRGKKKFQLALGLTRTKEAVLEEIAKCDLVCANCHRERTYRRRRKKHGKNPTT